MPRKTIHEYIEDSHDHHHDMDIDLEKQMGEARDDFIKHLQEDEAFMRLVADLARGRDKWKKLLDDRIAVLDDVIEWNNESIDPLLELYQIYLEEPSDEIMTQFSVLESRRMLMRDFSAIKMLLAKIGADINSINKRLAKIENGLKSK